MRLIALLVTITALVGSLAFAAPAFQETGRAGDGQAEDLAQARKLLTDRQIPVRLKAAMTLVQALDDKAIEVLIDLLADLRGTERLQAEQALQQLAGEWSPSATMSGDDELSRKVRREAWAGWWRTLDGPALLGVVREHSVNQTAEKDAISKMPLATPRLLAARKPAGAAEALLDFLPFAQGDSMKEEIGLSLKALAHAGGENELVLLKALSSAFPACRIAVAEALAGGGANHWPAVRKLLTDVDPNVRLRAGLALAQAHDKDALPALISLLAELPRANLWEAEDLLFRLAGPKAPVIAWGTDDPAARKRFHAAWQDWWKEYGAEVNLVILDKTRGAGLTIVAELGGKNKGGVVFAPVAGPGGPFPGNPAALGDRVIALDRNGQPRWQITNLNYPIDVQMLANERVLIAEYSGNRITERDLKGNIVWELRLPAFPGNVQRLANGNTFVALCGPTAVQNNGSPLLEVDPMGNIVARIEIKGGGAQQLPGGKGAVILRNSSFLQAAHKMADGKMICLLDDDTCVWLDVAGQEIKRFPVSQMLRAGIAYGNIDVTPKGHLLVMQMDNTVAEYDPDGKIVWQAKATGQRATRLPNGNTLVATLGGGVIELDQEGRIVWQYQAPPGFQAMRARRQ